MRKIPNINTHIFKQPNIPWRKSFYVRPLGGSYGLEDGSSYDNAWNGFTNVGAMPNNSILFIAGTHTEIYTIGQSNLSVRGDYNGDAGIINADNTRADCIVVADKTNIVISSITLQNSTFTCLEMTGASTVVTNNITIDGSANQGVQHEGTVQATHNNVTGSNCLDEVFSGHDDSVVVINGGTFTSNATVVNNVQSSHFTINGNCTFTSNTNDIQGNATTIANNQTFTGRVQASEGTITLNDCITQELESFTASTSFIIANRCVVNDLDIRANCEITLNNCILADVNNTLAGELKANDCYIKTALMIIGNGGTLTVRRSLFVEETAGASYRIMSGGSIDLAYCVFYSTVGTVFFNDIDAGAANVIYNNITITGNSKIGYTQQIVGNAVLNNVIFTNLTRAIHLSGGSVDTFNCCFFDNDNTDLGTVTYTDNVLTDPKLLSPSSLDYSLDVGSSCIGTGKTLSVSTGIDTADWGNGSSVVPIITTKEQGANWDIGAYIS